LNVGAKLITQIIWYGSVRTPFTYDFIQELIIGTGFRESRRCSFGETQTPHPADIPGVPVLGFLAGASLIRRSAFLDVGGFEPRLFIGGEEPRGPRPGIVRMADGLPRGHGGSALPLCSARFRVPALAPASKRHLGRMAEAPAGQCSPENHPPCHRSCAAGTCRCISQGHHHRPSWVLRSRRVIPPEVEAQLQQLGA
jgi:hypothetical protein